MTFFFDRHMAFEIVLRLRDRGVDVVHIRDASYGKKDVEWIPVVGQNGWILITADHAMLSRRLEKKSLRDNEVTAFFCPTEFNHWQARKRLDWLLEHWQTIEKCAAKAQSGDHFMISAKGKIMKRIPQDAS